MESESQHTLKINREGENMKRETKQKERNGIESGKRGEKEDKEWDFFLKKTCGVEKSIS